MFLTPLQRARRAAFTLIELLVVIAIIIILIALLFPALNGARERMNVALCLHNMQQLATAGFSYAVDHDGNLPRNNSGGQSGDWIVGFDPTGQSGLDSIHNGTLWPYTKEEKIYKCPSYPYHNLYKRTYSMADYVTGDGGQANVPDASWPVIHTLRDCRNPSQVIWFAEENPQGYPPYDGRPGINDGYFRSSGSAYIDKAGSFHLCSTPGTGKCNAVFLDGHGGTFLSYPLKSPKDEFYKIYQNYPNVK